MSIPMKAKKAFVYAGRRVAVGQEFNAHGQSDARVLAAIGNAERLALPAMLPRPNQYQTRVMTAAAPVAPACVIKVEGADVTLDAMDADELHKLADKLCVKVHHMAGAKKVREALVKSQQAAE